MNFGLDDCSDLPWRLTRWLTMEAQDPIDVIRSATTCLPKNSASYWAHEQKKPKH